MFRCLLVLLAHQQIMKWEPITETEAENLLPQSSCANDGSNKEWQLLKQGMLPGDQWGRYSNIDAFNGWASGEEGIAVLRDGEIVFKIVLSIIG